MEKRCVDSLTEELPANFISVALEVGKNLMSWASKELLEPNPLKDEP